MRGPRVSLPLGGNNRSLLHFTWRSRRARPTHLRDDPYTTSRQPTRSRYLRKPVRRCLGYALLGLKVHVEEAVTLVVTIGPVGIIYALREAGIRVPKDVSVIGVDDSMVGVIPRLELTSFRFDNERVGSVAFDLATNPRLGEPPHVLVPGTRSLPSRRPTRSPSIIA